MDFNDMNSIVSFVRNSLGNYNYNKVNPRRRSDFMDELSKVFSKDSPCKELIVINNGLSLPFARFFSKKELSVLKSFLSDIDCDFYGKNFTYYNTVDDIAMFTFNQIEDYKSDAKKKEEVMRSLGLIFGNDSELWKKIVSINEIRPAFANKLSKERLSILKDLLIEINAERYGSLNWKKFI